MATRRGTLGAADRPKFDKSSIAPDSKHVENAQTTTAAAAAAAAPPTPTPSSSTTTTTEAGVGADPRKPKQVFFVQGRGPPGNQGGGGAQRTLIPSRTPSAAGGGYYAQNYDEAPPGQPGPDLSAGRPAYTRGVSVMDNTALVSAGPTPAVEISNPWAAPFVKGTGGSRQRESHLPDLDIRDADFYGEEAFEDQPADEIEGTDEFGPALSRQDTEKGSGDPDRL